MEFGQHIILIICRSRFYQKSRNAYIGSKEMVLAFVGTTILMLGSTRSTSCAREINSVIQFEDIGENTQVPQKL
jgi:hypothetical protein